VAKILRPPKRFVEVIGGAVERDMEAREIKFYVTQGADPAAAAAQDAVGHRSSGAQVLYYCLLITLCYSICVF
jgi:hypothetical protein